MKTQGLKTEEWEVVLNESLHAIRSLLCTATNSTPHERFFNHQRRTTNGVSLPSWLTPGPVLAKRNVKHSKYEDSVEEVELLEANPQYALIQRKDGSESTISLRQLAPRGVSTGTSRDCSTCDNNEPLPVEGETQPVLEEQPMPDNNSPAAVPEYLDEATSVFPIDSANIRPQRERKPPSYLKDYVPK